ncbi:N(2)-fixation sustaining protein CowN, partial [Sulfurimonas sp.]|uniref:N(2)-fixation sustaining protein CowN n=1 Tax=Sulfurimonas sp. TaxID=2022749 RepID=UPI003D0D1B31
LDNIERLLASPENNNAFWDYFMKKHEGGSGPKPDNLFLIHSNINQVRELFESCGDEKGIELLSKLEEECC